MNKSTVPVSNEIWNLIKETQKNLKEISVSHKEAKQEMKELRASQKETDRQIQKMGGRFNQRWGTFVESLVSGNLVKILQKWGIDIMQTHTRSEAQWKKPDGRIQKREFDIIVANGLEVVVVEVKTTLYPKNVRTFLETLQNFKNYFPRYKSETIYGAVAYLTSEDKAHFFSEENGLFVIRATGNSASIINKEDFKPKAFS